MDFFILQNKGDICVQELGEDVELCGREEKELHSKARNEVYLEVSGGCSEEPEDGNTMPRKATVNIAKMPLKIHNATPSLSEICGYISEGWKICDLSVT